MEKKGNMNTRKEIKNMLPEKREWYAYSKDIKFNTHQYLENCYTQGRNDVLSVTANLLIDRVATMEEINEIVWDIIQCALDKGNYRAGGREELEQIFLDIEIPEKTTQALQKEFVILKREVK